MQEERNLRVNEVSREIARVREEVELTLAKPMLSPADTAVLQDKLTQLYKRYWSCVQGQ